MPQTCYSFGPRCQFRTARQWDTARIHGSDLHLLEHDLTTTDGSGLVPQPKRTTTSELDHGEKRGLVANDTTLMPFARRVLK